MPSKQTNIFKEAFDSIVFLGFVALLSVAATKASAWEKEMCGKKPVVKGEKHSLDAAVVLSSRKN
ncbi:MAG TPA: hypothetical protein VG737_00900 [Cyclobacteriaceae bacterium]|nr:hypothetical protein [Cyclobacteriaceae bacterium]